ncbi:MAG: excalibur calcium-binding domain-containing protein [Sporichthyaceae bacterium]
MRIAALACTAGMLVIGLGVPAAEAAGSAKTYANCTEMQKKYPHGVGKKGARDRISGKYVPGKSVTNFKVSAALYKANIKSDRDQDGVACEKR